MNAARWKEVTRIYAAVVASPASERANAVAALCGDDAELQREIESLLDESADGRHVLDSAPFIAEELRNGQHLAQGTEIGVYRIIGLLGIGGMGEVYRARDTKLNREVAIKILPAAVANDPDRLARFKREAQVLASLNHPNIGGIYGFEDTGSVHALVLELVEGPTLADMLGPKALSTSESLAIAGQIANALEAAHQQGITHRDLKPANIKVRADGTVKVLDFGLAKITDPDGVAGRQAGVTNSPTITTPAMTAAGIILGTAAYMSPEQAKGRPADQRSDIWSFGCVLYEMLTGQRPFDGETISDVLASVLKTEPAWRLIPADVPAPLQRLVHRCLDKNPRTRLQAIGEARVQIERLISGAPDEFTAPQSVAAIRGTSPRFLAIAAAMLIVPVIAGVLITRNLMTAPLPVVRAQTTRFSFVPPAADRFATITQDREFAISPDGSRIAYAGTAQVMIRPMDRLEAVAVRGADNARSPFFSPDSRSIGFFTRAQGELRTVPVTGGSSRVMTHYAGTPRGATWGPDDTIVFATTDLNSGLLRVPATGGPATVLTTPDGSAGEVDHLFPSMLPDGRHVLFTIATANGAAQDSQVAVLDLVTGKREILVRGGGQAHYVSSGHLVYASTGSLNAVRFELSHREVVGNPTPMPEQPILRQTNRQTGQAYFAVSRDGTLVYLPADIAVQTEARSLVWVNRQGREEPLNLPRRPYAVARLSPNGDKVALDIRDSLDVWIHDLVRHTEIRLTSDPSGDAEPVWTPDGERIVWSSSRDADNGNLYWQAADGTGKAERLTTSPFVQFPTAVSRDGTLLFFTGTRPGFYVLNAMQLPEPGAAPPGPSQTRELLPTSTAQRQQNGEISPDGHWLAYQSNESGVFQVYVRPFPNVQGGLYPISPAGGTRPAWSHDGRELFYLDADDRLTTVAVQTTATTFHPGLPTRILDARYYAGFTPRGLDLRGYDVAPDGKRFLMIKGDLPASISNGASLHVVLNWAEELKARVPNNRR